MIVTICIAIGVWAITFVVGALWLKLNGIAMDVTEIKWRLEDMEKFHDGQKDKEAK